MTWFAHQCWFCRHKSKAVVFIVGDSHFQCIDHVACIARRKAWDAPACEPELPCEVQVVQDVGPHDWKATSYSNVANVETNNYRCTRCGASKSVRTEHNVVCVDEP